MLRMRNFWGRLLGGQEPVLGWNRGGLRGEVNCMSDARRLAAGCLLQPEVRHGEPQEGQDRKPRLLTYCAVSGLIATTAGAGVTLVTSGTARLLAWFAVLVLVSVAAGLAYGSSPLGVVRQSCRHLVRRVFGS
jgi:hypothetical protein